MQLSMAAPCAPADATPQPGKSAVQAGGQGGRCPGIRGFCPLARMHGDAAEACACQGVEVGEHVKDGPLPMHVCLVPYLGLSDLVRNQAVCTTWRRLGEEEGWVERCVLSGSLAAGGERLRFWRHLANVSAVEEHWGARLAKEEARGQPLDGLRAFEVLSSRELPYGKAAEIERDVTRTLPRHRLFDGQAGTAGRRALSNILCAFSAAEPEIGYCQGMNFVAAVLLIHLGSAHEAFWMLLAMIDSYHFRHVFAPGVPLLPLRVFQFSGLAREHVPRLWRHLQAESFSLDIFAQQSVMTLFAYSIDPDIIVYAWDAFFLLGWSAVFRIGLGLLASMEPTLLQMSVEHISRSLHQRQFSPPADPARTGGAVRTMLQELLRFDVQHGALDALQIAFQVQHWEELLEKVDSTQRLPDGITRSPSGANILLDLNSLQTHSSPPRCRSRCHRPSPASRSPPPNGCTAGTAPGSSSCRVPREEVRQLKEELAEFDVETNRAVASFRSRVAATEKELVALQAETETGRAELAEAQQERMEWLDYKQALMQSLQAAVRTSPVVAGGKIGRDDLVMKCSAKLRRLESEMYDVNERVQAKTREMQPSIDRLNNLGDAKTKAMTELIDFAERRFHSRRRRLEESIAKVLARPVHLNGSGDPQ